MCGVTAHQATADLPLKLPAKTVRMAIPVASKMRNSDADASNGRENEQRSGERCDIRMYDRYLGLSNELCESCGKRSTERHGMHLCAQTLCDVGKATSSSRQGNEVDLDALCDEMREQLDRPKFSTAYVECAKYPCHSGPGATLLR